MGASPSSGLRRRWALHGVTPSPHQRGLRKGPHASPDPGQGEGSGTEARPGGAVRADCPNATLQPRPGHFPTERWSLTPPSLFHLNQLCLNLTLLGHLVNDILARCPNRLQPCHWSLFQQKLRHRVAETSLVYDLPIPSPRPRADRWWLFSTAQFCAKAINSYLEQITFQKKFGHLSLILEEEAKGRCISTPRRRVRMLFLLASWPAHGSETEPVRFL
jgi:hypothetical protein